MHGSQSTERDAGPAAFTSPGEVVARLDRLGYIADDALAMSVFLAVKMQRPLFVEGAPGVGKTMLARVLAEALGTTLIRLQCYEGLDLAQAAYEWNYPRQLLELQTRGGDTARIFSDAFLLKRPLLQAIDAGNDRAPVLLIDEIDRADEEFESFLLELLSDFQITIPEMGTQRARHRPVVVLTSNRTRDVHDALKRRCIFQWIDYPPFEREVSIVRRKVAGLSEHVTQRLVGFTQTLRRQDLTKVPGVAETVDWAESLAHLGVTELDERVVSATLGLLLKYQDDLVRVRGALPELLARSPA